MTVLNILPDRKGPPIMPDHMEVVYGGEGKKHNGEKGNTIVVTCYCALYRRLAREGDLWPFSSYVWLFFAF